MLSYMLVSVNVMPEWGCDWQNYASQTLANDNV